MKSSDLITPNAQQIRAANDHVIDFEDDPSILQFAAKGHAKSTSKPQRRNRAMGSRTIAEIAVHLCVETINFG
jgi:hypothetical protein